MKTGKNNPEEKKEFFINIDNKQEDIYKDIDVNNEEEKIKFHKLLFLKIDSVQPTQGSGYKAK